MRTSGWRRRGALRRQYHSYLLDGAILIVTGCLCALIQGSLWSQATVLAVVNLATSLTFIGTGLLLRRDRGQRQVAWALMLAGAFRALDFADSYNSSGPWPLYDLVFGGLDRLAGAYALLRYPNAALLRSQRIYLIALAGWMLVGRTLIAATSIPAWNGDPASSWWPTLWPNLGLSDLVSDIVNAGEGALGVGLAVLLALRLMRTRGLDRIVITPVIVAGIATVIAAIVTAVAQMLSQLANGPNDAYIAEGIVDLALPLAFLVAAVQSGLLLRNITGLTAQISAGADVEGVRHALRAALRDPTLEVLDLSAAGLGLRDAETGDLIQEPDAVADDDAALALADVVPRDRLVELIRTEAGAPIAVVIADPGLARYRGLFNTAVQTSGLALKNAQLQARAARAELTQVRASRARLVEAGLAERRRLERDLHDGAQQHLLAVAAQLSAAITRVTDPAATAAFYRAQAELAEVLAELRDLAHGIHPAILTQSGLAAALEEVAERLPLPVDVDIPQSRVAPAVEATAYFVACEALANVVKHAEASSAQVTVHIVRSWLEMEVSDNGKGCTAPDGRGLANMRDRVGALDGEVTIDSPVGGGMRIWVRLPCA